MIQSIYKQGYLIHFIRNIVYYYDKYCDCGDLSTEKLSEI